MKNYEGSYPELVLQATEELWGTGKHQVLRHLL
jgi:hypothetical protein